MSKIIVKINPKNAEVTYEVNGVQGSKCEHITEAIVRSNSELEKQYTSEFYGDSEMPDYVTSPIPEDE